MTSPGRWQKRKQPTFMVAGKTSNQKRNEHVENIVQRITINAAKKEITVTFFSSPTSVETTNSQQHLSRKGGVDYFTRDLGSTRSLFGLFCLVLKPSGGRPRIAIQLVINAAQLRGTKILATRKSPAPMNAPARKGPNSPQRTSLHPPEPLRLFATARSRHSGFESRPNTIRVEAGGRKHDGSLRVAGFMPVRRAFGKVESS